MKGLLSLLSQNKYYYITILLFIVGGGILLLLTTKDVVTLWINHHHDPFLDSLFLITNRMGEGWFIIAVLAFIWVVKGWRYTLLAVICFALSLGITTFAKHVLFPGELRPVPYFEGKEILRLIEGVIQLETESFPSGHTTVSFSIYTFLALVLSKKQWHWTFVFLAALVAYARMYLSQHFITDVYTGMIIGVVVTTLTYYLIRKKTGLLPFS